MAVTLSTPDVDQLEQVSRALGEWQYDGAPIQLHPGDLGWFRRFGASTTAEAIRTWSANGALVAVGLLDGADLLRLAIAPRAVDDAMLAEQMLTDVTMPARGVLPAGTVYVENRSGPALRRSLSEAGWTLDEPWTPLRRDLTNPVEDCGLRIEVVDEDPTDRVAVQRAAFDNSTFTEERWHDMASGSTYSQARCLVGYDDLDNAVAAVTVWSAGPSKPGLLEPMGVHRDHRGRGHGVAICVAAAAALREMGASSATVCTPGSNTGAIATYVSAGYERLPDVQDLCRGADNHATQAD